MLDVKQATKVFSAGTASEHHALNGLDLHLDDGGVRDDHRFQRSGKIDAF